MLAGLDAFQEEMVMETLQQLAQEGHTIVCSIHQPRGSIYAKFDDLILLSKGAVVYDGHAQEEPLFYFDEHGFVICISVLIMLYFQMICCIWTFFHV